MKRHCARVTERGEEAWNETASRGTRSAYEAVRSGTERGEQSAEAIVAGQQLARAGQPGEVRSLWPGEGPNGWESRTTVSLEGTRRQMSTQVELPLEERGESPNVQRSGEALAAANGTGRSGTDHLHGWSNAAMSWEYPVWLPHLNQPNRRMRTRMSGGVGGD